MRIRLRAHMVFEHLFWSFGALQEVIESLALKWWLSIFVFDIYAKVWVGYIKLVQPD